MRSLVFVLLIFITPLLMAVDHQNDSDRDPVSTGPITQSSTPPAPNHHGSSTTLPGRSTSKLVKPVKKPRVEPQRFAAETMRISQLTQHCVMPNGVVSFSGKDLLALADADLAIQGGRQVIVLQPLVVSKHQVSYRLPAADKLKANNQYSVVIFQAGTPQQMTEITLSICPENKAVLSNKNDYEPGQIVLLLPPKQQVELNKQLQQLGYQILQSEQLESLQRVLVVLAVEHSQIENTLATLRQSFPDIVIDLNNHFQPVGNTENISKPRLYAKKQLAWQDNTDCQLRWSQLKLGLIDGQVDSSHPALSEQNIVSKNFLMPMQAADSEHGTAIASIFLADKPELGLQGLLVGSSLYSAEVLRKQQKESLATLTSIVKALDWLLGHDIRLINVSLAGSNENQILTTVFEQAISQGSIIFAAAGNNGKEAAEAHPAAIKGVITITALDAAKRIYKKSNQGSYIDFAAPGVDVWAADTIAIAKYYSGTSYAAPYAVATAALYLAQNTSIPRDIIYQALQNSAHDLGQQGRDPVFGWGLLQASEIYCKK